MKQGFDVIVIGAGHAGCEAARAAAARGARAALVTLDRRMIGAMSCNPAIGGIGKGHIVREVDVFGGLIADAADRAAIHYRMLNRSRGRAVWGPRVQADRRLFADAVQAAVAGCKNMTVIEGEVTSLDIAGDRIAGVRLGDGTRIDAAAVVIATGTFLSGRLFIGRSQQQGGRWQERAATRLGEQLREIGAVGRLKTGTPPRLDGRTIDWSRLDRQDSDTDGWTMAPYGSARHNPQIACGITRTHRATHDIIRANAAESPLACGDIEGAGPRYCPSIEDKVRRFGDRDGHQVFLEPEGLDDIAVYPNGLSTSLPAAAQTAFLRSIAGLETVEVMRPGYAVEYDFLDPRGLDHGLASRSLPGLYLAGQVNGTTGYEEAAGQGLVAGLNAAAHACDRAPVRFDRQDSYIGVMIDDLVLQGVTEPYRMLTARAEFRLHLRSDNAEARLGELALSSDCLPGNRRGQVRARLDRRAALMNGAADGDDDLSREVQETLHYRPYVERERRAAAAASQGLNVPIDPSFDYAALPGLSDEMRERLSASRPATILDAQRIRGISPAAITALLSACRRRAA